MQRKEFIKGLIRDFKSGVATLSYTAISKFKRSPKSFIDYKMEDKEQTDAMLLGSVVHCLVLEPSKFTEKYISDKDMCDEIGGSKPRSTNAYKAWKSSQTATVISHDVYELSMLMADAVKTNEASKWVLERCNEFETKVEFSHNGLKFVAFIDGRGSVMCDLKICSDAEPKKFQRDIVNMNYHLQGGTYTIANGEILPYYIIAVDRNAGVSVHLLEDSFIEYGMNEFDSLTNQFKQCLETNSFHKSFEYRAPTDNGFYVMSRPPWL